MPHESFRPAEPTPAHVHGLSRRDQTHIVREDQQRPQTCIASIDPSDSLLCPPDFHRAEPDVIGSAVDQFRLQRRVHHKANIGCSPTIKGGIYDQLHRWREIWKPVRSAVHPDDVGSRVGIRGLRIAPRFFVRLSIPVGWEIILAQASRPPVLITTAVNASTDRSTAVILEQLRPVDFTYVHKSFKCPADILPARIRQPILVDQRAKCRSAERAMRRPIRSVLCEWGPHRLASSSAAPRLDSGRSSRGWDLQRARKTGISRR
jgi:hypothetical protein